MKKSCDTPSLKKRLRFLEKMVYKKIVLIRFFIIALLLFPFWVRAQDDITADAFLLVEKDSFAILAGREYHRELPPASTTKVMTTILALEKLSDDDVVVPDRKVLALPFSKLCLLPGKQYKAADLIKGAMVESANDAAYALSVAIAGSEANFADMMNRKAREIGALDTHFTNGSGLYVPGQHTSCYDLALMFRYALHDEKFRDIVSTKYFLFKKGNRHVKYMNHNRLLFCFEPSIGGKTGFTRVSKHCYVGAFEKEGKVYILSMLGSRNLWGDAVSILGQVYDQVPTAREIHLAKASVITLSSFTQKKEKAPAVKKKSKKAKRGRAKIQRKT